MDTEELDTKPPSNTWLPAGLTWVKTRYPTPPDRWVIAKAPYPDVLRAKWLFDVAADYLLRYLGPCGDQGMTEHAANSSALVMSYLVNHGGRRPDALATLDGAFVFPRDSELLAQIVFHFRDADVADLENFNQVGEVAKFNLRTATIARIFKLEGAVCQCRVHALLRACSEEHSSICSQLEAFMQIEAVVARFTKRVEQSWDARTVLDTLSSFGCMHSASFVRNNVQAAVARSLIAARVPAALMYKMSVQRAACTVVFESAEHDLKASLQRSLAASQHMIAGFRNMNTVIFKYLDEKDFRNALKAFGDVEDLAESFTANRVRDLVTEVELLKRLSKDRNLRASQWTSMNSVRTAWKGDKKSLDYFIRRAATKPSFVAMNVKSLAEEVAGRYGYGGLGGFLLNRIDATSKTAVYGTDQSSDTRSETERLDVLRELCPSVIGPYLDGVSLLTCEEVCAKFRLRMALKDPACVEERWCFMLQTAVEYPGRGWRRLAQDALRSIRVKKVFY